MKKLLESTKTRTLTLILGLLFSVNGHCLSSLGPVIEVKGNVFALRGDGLKVIKRGDDLYLGTEIMSEEGAQVTIGLDGSGEMILSGSTHLKIEENGLTLVKGFIWYKASQLNTTYIVSSANAMITPETLGEAIFSFDETSGRSQLLVINGEFKIQNSEDQLRSQIVGNGGFSFIHRDYKEGSPRVPTAIGSESFKKTISLFEGISPKTQGQTRPQREVASLPDIKPAKKLKIKQHRAHIDSGDVVILKKASSSGPLRKSAPKVDVHDYYRKIASEQKVNTLKENTSKSKESLKLKQPKITIFRLRDDESKRVPSSVGPSGAGFRVRPTIESKLDESLNKQSNRQKRFSPEVESLIKDLKSLDRDYNISY